MLQSPLLQSPLLQKMLQSRCCKVLCFLWKNTKSTTVMLGPELIWNRWLWNLKGMAGWLRSTKKEVWNETDIQSNNDLILNMHSLTIQRFACFLYLFLYQMLFTYIVVWTQRKWKITKHLESEDNSRIIEY